MVQGNSTFHCECRRKRFDCEYHFLEDSDWEYANIKRSEYCRRNPGRVNRLLIVRNEHVPLNGCVVVQKFERSSIIYYT